MLAFFFFPLSLFGFLTPNTNFIAKDVGKKLGEGGKDPETPVCKARKWCQAQKGKGRGCSAESHAGMAQRRPLRRVLPLVRNSSPLPFLTRDLLAPVLFQMMSG